jgi:hypothetical protein
MGPYDRVSYNSPYLIVSSIDSYPPPPPPPLNKGLGETGLYENTSTERGREGVKADIMSLDRHFMDHGQPHA